MTYLIPSLFLIFLSLFLFQPKWGVYLLALLLPVIGFELAIGSFSFPLIDFLAFALFLAFAFRSIYFILFDKQKIKKFKFPLLFPFFLFLFVSLISSILSPEPLYSLWYFCRWPLFLYFAYILVPYNLITEQKTLKRTIITAAFSSLVVLIFGFLSFYGQDWTDSFFRIRSLPIFGVFPFGKNHNLIAEFLNVGAFFVLSLRFLAKKPRFKKSLDITFLFFVLGIILTFSRSGWLVLFLQAGVYLIIFFQQQKSQKKIPGREIILSLGIIMIILFPLFIKMNRLQEDNVSSTENRLLLTEISIEAFKEKPILGHGSGSFIRLVDDNVRFRAKYGEAIDSHGVIQKVLAENGLFGIIAWFFIIFYLLKIFYQAIKKYSASHPWLSPLIIGALGGLFFQFLNTSYYKGKVWLPIVLALLAIKLVENNYGKKENRKN